MGEPFRIQSANGTITVEEEAQIHVPALNIWIWAQLVEDCPAVVSLGILCGKQGWNYEWKNGDLPTMSKGSTSIALTPHHDVPMIFAAKKNENSEESSAESTSPSSCKGRPCAQVCGGTTFRRSRGRNTSITIHQPRVIYDGFITVTIRCRQQSKEEDLQTEKAAIREIKIHEGAKC